MTTEFCVNGRADDNLNLPRASKRVRRAPSAGQVPNLSRLDLRMAGRHTLI